jgi:hypothetical protein
MAVLKPLIRAIVSCSLSNRSFSSRRNRRCLWWAPYSNQIGSSLDIFNHIHPDRRHLLLDPCPDSAARLLGEERDQQAGAKEKEQEDNAQGRVQPPQKSTDDRSDAEATMVGERTRTKRVSRVSISVTIRPSRSPLRWRYRLAGACGSIF